MNTHIVIRMCVGNMTRLYVNEHIHCRVNVCNEHGPGDLIALANVQGKFRIHTRMKTCIFMQMCAGDMTHVYVNEHTYHHADECV